MQSPLTISVTVPVKSPLSLEEGVAGGVQFTHCPIRCCFAVRSASRSLKAELSSSIRKPQSTLCNGNSFQQCSGREGLMKLSCSDRFKASLLVLEMVLACQCAVRCSFKLSFHPASVGPSPHLARPILFQELHQMLLGGSSLLQQLHILLYTLRR